MTDDDHKDPKVKELVERAGAEPLEQFVDAETAAQLHKWFGLPSFAQVEAGERKPVPPDDLEPEVAAVRERRQRVLADIDPAFLAAIERRHTPPDDLFKFTPTIEPLTADIALFDPTPYAKRKTVNEYGEEVDDSGERFYPWPEDIQDALHESTPQALLRDLHRPETDFDQPQNDEYMSDEEQAPPEPYLVDVHAKIDAVMKLRFRVEPFVPPDITTAMDEFRNGIAVSWVEVANSGALYNRRVTE